MNTVTDDTDADLMILIYILTEDMTDNYDDAVTGPNSNIMLSKFYWM